MEEVAMKKLKIVLGSVAWILAIGYAVVIFK